MKSNKRILFCSIFSLALIGFTACSTDNEIPQPREEPAGAVDSPANKEGATIWTGAAITFDKADGADPNQAANQDRLTDNVWITRGNNGGQIFNAKAENAADKDLSPKGTEWALGTIDEIETLNFKPFRAAVGKPKDIVGKDLVLHLIQDDVYLSIKFTSFSSDKAGGFVYERSTESGN